MFCPTNQASVRRVRELGSVIKSEIVKIAKTHGQKQKERKREYRRKEIHLDGRQALYRGESEGEDRVRHKCFRQKTEGR